jgi:type III restriction enzyme
LMSDADGKFPVTGLNPWEIKVIESEMSRPGALAWYRNPSRPAIDSLTIAYRDQRGNWHSMHPDFIFFHADQDGAVRASIVDPHGHHLPDAPDKLRALGEFADRYGDRFDRIEQVSQFGNVMRTIPLHDQANRDAVRAGGRTIVEFYQSNLALNYEPGVAK